MDAFYCEGVYCLVIEYIRSLKIPQVLWMVSTVKASIRLAHETFLTTER